MSSKTPLYKRRTYQGHKNWNYWNVSLWIHNTYKVYMFADYLVKTHKRDDAVRKLTTYCKMYWHKHQGKTPDGAPINKTNVRAALTHWGK